MNSVTKSDLFICATEALFGIVTPNLRKVVVTAEDAVFCLYFLYDKPLSEEEEELVSLAHTEFIAGLKPTDYKTDCKIIILPFPKKSTINVDGAMCVYARYESPIHQPT